MRLDWLRLLSESSRDGSCHVEERFQPLCSSALPTNSVHSVNSVKKPASVFHWKKCHHSSFTGGEELHSPQSVWNAVWGISFTRMTMP